MPHLTKNFLYWKFKCILWAHKDLYDDKSLWNYLNLSPPECEVRWVKDIYTDRENTPALMFKLDLQFSVIFHAHAGICLASRRCIFLGPLGVIVSVFKVFSLPVAFNTSSFFKRLYQWYQEFSLDDKYRGGRTSDITMKEQIRFWGGGKHLDNAFRINKMTQ